MRTVILGERPPELESFLERRRALGQDTHDEVWQGVYHVAPHAHTDHGIVEVQLTLALGPRAAAGGLVMTTAFNLGEPDDFRIPDLGVFRDRPGVLYAATALMVVEVLSPDDETYEKLPFYVASDVQEVLIAHPQERWVHCYDLRSGTAVRTDHSSVLDLPMRDLEAEIAWP